MKRLNLCSGQRPFGNSCSICGAKPELHPAAFCCDHTYSPLWINVDSQERWNPDVVADCSHMPMFEDASADMIVIHHGLEHFGCGEADAMLKECYRMLSKGGSLLVFVPDMRALAQRWLARQIDTQLYMTNVYGAYMGDEADRHKWGFTALPLAETLEKAGFDKFKAFDWRKIPGADIAGPDWWILAAEAIK